MSGPSITPEPVFWLLDCRNIWNGDKIDDSVGSKHARRVRLNADKIQGGPGSPSSE